MRSTTFDQTHSAKSKIQQTILNPQNLDSEEKSSLGRDKPGNTKRGSITVPFDLLFDWFGLVCFANKNKNC
jgi:hypothetical protein